MTNGEIDRLGDRIRTEIKISDQTLQDLQNYRTSHKDTLSEVFNELCTFSKKASILPIVTYRIKRFESIIGKLGRYPDMRFNRMWDIGGCRCILKSDNDVYKLKELIRTKSKLQIRKEKDYIREPQEDGYKSLHLFVSMPNNPIVIEVQIRNQTDHNWATLVEITDLLFDANLKEYGENKDLLKFHLLLSKRNKLEIEDKKQLSKLINDYKYFDRLSVVFSKNYIQVRKQWLEIEEKQNHKFFLIVSKKDEVPKITSFKNFIEAEQTYFDFYKTAQNSNIVLTHLPSPNYHQISIAYSNYILTFHSFFDDCYEIFESLISDSLKNRNYLNFNKYFDLYNAIEHNHIKNLVMEILEVNKILEQSSKVKGSKSNGKEKEWKTDIDKQIKKRQENIKRLHFAFNRNVPTTIVGRLIFIQIVKYISRKYHKKLTKTLNIKQA